MSELDDLRSLVAVVETGGFARAGKSLGLAKSVVSRRVARLEEELGTRLLDRTTRGVGATEAGLAFKDRAERILADLAEARESVARDAEGISGRLRLSMPLSFGIRHVAPILADLAKLHPKLEIDADASDRHVDLVAERFDAAIRIGQLKDSSLVARRIASVRVAVVGSPDYLARRGRPQKPQDLAGHDGLIYTGSNQQEWRFGSGRSEVNVRPSGRLRSDSGDTLLRWALAGLGLAALPTFLISDEIRSGRLEHVLTEFPSPEAGLYVVRPPGAYVPGKVRLLIETLVDRFGGTPYWDPCQAAIRAREADPKAALPPAAAAAITG